GDFNPQERHAVTLRYAGQNNRSQNDLAGFLTVFTDASGGNKQFSNMQSLLGSWTWTMSPQVVNQFLYQWSTFDNQLSAISNLRHLAFPDGLTVGQSPHVPEHTFQRKHQFRDDLSWSRGSHGLKFGAD